MRRYRCTRCRTVVTVVPSDVLSRRHYGAVAVALAFALFGVLGLSAAPVRRAISTGRVVGVPEARAEALARLEFIADCYLSVGAPAPHALPAMLARGGAAQGAIRARVAANLRALDGDFVEGSPATRARADGGWYACVRLRQTRREERWVLDALDAGEIAQG